MIWLVLLLALVFAKYGGGLAKSYETAERRIGWVFLLAGLALAFAAGGRAHASPPVIYSPYVIQMWQPAPLTDESGYARTTAACAVFSDYPANRVYPAGTVFRLLINPNAHPLGDPSVWGYTADNQRLQGVYPLYGGPGFYLPVSCLEGVKPA